MGQAPFWTLLLAACLFASSSGQQIGRIECNSLVDLVFIVDSSGSIQANDWRSMQTFMRDMVEKLTIGSSLSRIGLVTFENVGKVAFTLDEFLTKQEVQQKILSLEKNDGNTNTSGGLLVAKDLVFGLNSNRPEIPDVAIVLTDGQSTYDEDKTLDSAQALRDANVKVFVVGITAGVDERELQGISSMPQRLNENYFLSPNFEMLSTILDKVIEETCKTIFVDLNQVVDLVIVLDASSSGGIGMYEWDKKLDFLAAVVDRLNVQTRVGLVVYGDFAQSVFFLNTYNNKADIKMAIMNAPFLGSATRNTAAALREMHFNQYNVAKGDRLSIYNYVLFITHGRSTVDSFRVVSDAFAAHSDGIRILGFGIGMQVDEFELSRISSAPHQKDLTYWMSSSIEILPSYVESLLRETAVTTPEPALSDECRSNVVDLVILLDSSGSIRESNPPNGEYDNFQLMIDFISGIVNRLNIGFSATRVGLVIFSDQARSDFYLRTYTSKAQVLNAISNLPFMGSMTNTVSALREMHYRQFTLENGDRPEIPNLAIVVTDGVSNVQAERTIIEAEEARRNGIKIITVGITDRIDESELRLMSSLPQREGENYWKSADFTTLTRIQNAIVYETCASTIPPTTLPPLTPAPGCATNIADVVFVIDNSNSIRMTSPRGTDYWAVQLEFIKSIVEKLDIGFYKTRVGLVHFSNEAISSFFLKDYFTVEELKMAIDNVPYIGALTNLTGGIKEMQYSQFSTRNGNRPDIQDVAVIITDGASNLDQSLVVPSAMDARNAGIKILSIGVTVSVNFDELKSISAMPQVEGQTFWLSPSFDRLQEIVGEVVASVCSREPIKGEAGATGLPGLQGQPGRQGGTGFTGFPGRPGQPGATGLEGRTGATGQEGIRGSPGIDGRSGATGATGFPGRDGLPGRSGAMGATGFTGRPGTGIDGPIGATGRDGRTGATGLPGQMGLPGLQGASGLIGRDGRTGSTGATGLMGRNGVDGRPGITGATGFQGPQGSPGLNGLPGRDGSTGFTGMDGRTGATGRQGGPGVQGRPGIDGRDGFPGVTGSTGATGRGGRTGATGLPGRDGRTGSTGFRGFPGRDGLPGQRGQDGQTGATGLPGLEGRRGFDGRPGEMGATGRTGATGQTGATGLQGIPGRDGPLGLPGQRGRAGATGMRGDVGQPGATGLRGIDGIPGATGATGLTGATGRQGETGFSGRDGSTGHTGFPGFHGFTGFQGLRGRTGATGPVGATGVGRTGASGATGPQGRTGATGFPGRDGQSGATGRTGATGATGFDGIPGRIGATGRTGFDGRPGQTGATGIQGVPGLRGFQGRDGRTGSTGAPGLQGRTGATGLAGLDGRPGEFGATGRTGATGQPGRQGVDGRTGATGQQGLRGVPGLRGAVGFEGRPGSMGNPGREGATGERGRPGFDGRMGAQGATGRDGRTGGTGLTGRDGVTGATGMMGRAGNTGGTGAIGFPGRIGATGERGFDGRPGVTGATGFRGRDGRQGATGFTGSDGRAGDTGQGGRQGLPGLNGERGSAGATGLRGRDGLTGATGSTGFPGRDGRTGDTGATGREGRTGATGFIGATGRQGLSGMDGKTGATGLRGRDGFDGRTGATGIPGFDGRPGAIGATGRPGQVGQRGFDGRQGEPGRQGLPGLQGRVGATGRQGRTGATGQRGLDGRDGAQGLTGATGLNGPDGMPGRNGRDGDPGLMGARGLDGRPGLPGQDGRTGATGLRGRDGRTGATGTIGRDGLNLNGPAGATGEMGPMGFPGRDGQTGATGATGRMGRDGATGFPGRDGATGATGLSRVGATGSPGRPGIEGVRGSAGFRGADGRDGRTGATGAAGSPGASCTVNECTQNKGGCEQECIDTYNSHYCACRKGFQQVTIPISCPGISENCASAKLDIVLVVDSSGSIRDNNPPGSDNYRSLKEFLQRFVSSLTIGFDFTRVGLVIFSNIGESIFYLDTYYDSGSIEQAILNMKYIGGNTNTSGGLREMMMEQFTISRGDRPNVENIAIVITDGKSTFDSARTIPDATEAHRRNIKIFSIGVTGDVDEAELRGISSDPKEKGRNFFTSVSFQSLDEIRESLLKETCRITGLENLYCEKTALDGFQCFCKYGECDVRSVNGTRCEDINECAIRNGGCHQTCINDVGSYRCECGTGYVLARNLHSCEDVNECNNNPCRSGELCTNTRGSYFCSNVGGMAGLQQLDTMVAQSSFSMGTLVGVSVLSAVVALSIALAIMLGIRQRGKSKDSRKEMDLCNSRH